MPKLLADGRRQAGRHLVRLFVRSWDDEGSRNPILTLLRAATIEPQAAEMLNELMRVRLYGPLMRLLRADQPELQADLVLSQLLGLGLVRYVLRLEPLSSAPPDQVVEWVAPSVQRYLTGRLEPR